MWKKIVSLVNTGKKLKISPEKLFSLAIANSFQGSIAAHADDATEIIYFNSPDISSDSAPEALAFSISKALFSLSDTPGKGQHSAHGYLFLQKFIAGYPDALIASKLAAHQTKVLVVRKEVSSLPAEILKPIEKCVEKKRIPVAELMDASIKGVYFLLITGFAALNDPTASEQKQIESAAEEPTTKDSVAAPSSEDKLKAYQEHIKKTSDPTKRLKKYLRHLKNYRSIFDLFDSEVDTDRDVMKKKYMEIIKKLHPDQLSDVDGDLRKEAEDMLALVNDLYILIKEDESYSALKKFTLLKRRIMTKEDFEREIEIDDIAMKGEALFRLKEYTLAYKMFKDLYAEAAYPEFLEKMMWSYYRDESLSRPDKTLSNHDRREKMKKRYSEIFEMIEKMMLVMGQLPISIMFIEAEMAENLGNLRACRQILKDILLRDPRDFRAQGWLKKVIFYEEREKKAEKKKKR